MQPMHRTQPQNTRRRGPKLALPLDADVVSVRYYACPPKETLPVKEHNPFVPKVHLKYIPPALRRPTPWSEFLTDWLSSCEAKKDGASSSSSSSSGASSAETAISTDFSSVSSPRQHQQQAAPVNRIDHGPVPAQQPPQHLQQQHPFRVLSGNPAATRLTPAQWAELSDRCVPASSGSNAAATQLTPAQWTELARLQQAAAARRVHAPPKLMSLHTAYLPELDAAVRAMMQPADTQLLQQHALLRTVPGLPWQQQQQQYAAHYYANEQRFARQVAAPAAVPQPASSCSSSTVDSGSSHHRKDISKTCSFCYQVAVHEAHSKNVTLPRITSKGFWTGHETRDGETIVCPRLLRRVCSLCGATGQSAHPTNYCPATKSRTSCY